MRGPSQPANRNTQLLGGVRPSRGESPKLAAAASAGTGKVYPCSLDCPESHITPQPARQNRATRRHFTNDEFDPGSGDSLEAEYKNVRSRCLQGRRRRRRAARRSRTPGEVGGHEGRMSEGEELHCTRVCVSRRHQRDDTMHLRATRKHRR